jgi:excisionase family DNA binding protein
MSDERVVLTVEEAGKRLGLSRESAYKAVREGSIPAIRIGNLWKVPVVQLDRLLEGK